MKPPTPSIPACTQAMSVCRPDRWAGSPVSDWAYNWIRDALVALSVLTLLLAAGCQTASPQALPVATPVMPQVATPAAPPTVSVALPADLLAQVKAAANASDFDAFKALTAANPTLAPDIAIVAVQTTSDSGKIQRIVLSVVQAIEQAVPDNDKAHEIIVKILQAVVGSMPDSVVGPASTTD